MSVAIGIDLGTTNTVVAAVVDGVAVTLEGEGGRRLLPSVVSFQPNGTVLVGDAAREKRLADPENTIFSVKPLFGRGWNSDETQAARARFPFKLVEGAKSSTMVEARGVAYALPEISAFVLRRAKAVAEAALKQPVDRAVITVPANFNDLQRASTKIAGKLAGLEVMRILNEPTAAALAYGQSIKQAEKIAIYDLGGGTFDVTLLDLTNSVFEVLATAGDTALGGDDVDRVIADRIIKEVSAKLRVDSRGNPQAIARIAFLAEEIKKHLSTNDLFDDELTGVAYKSNGRTPLSLPFKMTRAELEQAARPLLDRTVTVAQQSIASVGLTVNDIERIILVGGATRMPLVARIVEGLFGRPPALKVNPDEVVALGAAIQAHALNRAKGAHKQVLRAAAKPPPLPRPTPKAMPAVSPSAGGTGPYPKAPSSDRLPAYRPASSSKLPAVRPASTPGMAAVRPPSKPGMTAVQAPAKPPPLPPRASQPKTPAAKPADDHPALGEMMTFSKGAAIVSWDLPSDEPAPPSPPPMPAPAPAPPPPAAKPMAFELDVPDLDMPKPAVGPTDIVAAPADEFGLDLPMDLGPAHAPPPAPSSVGAVGAVEEFGEIDLATAFTPERFQQGSAIATSAATPLLIDVTPLSLGVETAGGYADVLIPANSPVPCEKTRTFLTANDGQTTVTVRVAQGESPKFAGNTRLGDVELSGLRAGYRGEVKISVTFELDADGILNVRARDPDTGRETVATMRLVTGSTSNDDMLAMSQRQAQYTVR
ncbi:MAG: Hsp70 family protein [Labilithrix sp.]|nr:Hsp70 family protein [Labilithrix sp.]MCW5815384.1 Hsp70 family protein [Labilithrix sp.]